jgi:D-alanine-D-alanine ligase
MKVLVLLGGVSSEREVSLDTGAGVAAALESAGHEVTTFDPAPDGRVEPATLLGRVLRGGFDVVFVALHGGGGEDGHIQAVLDLAGVPYTGSGMAASYLAMDKVVAKTIFEKAGIPTPAWRSPTGDPQDVRVAVATIGGYPVVTKPVCGGSTVGISIVEDESALDSAVAEALRWDDRLLIERYIAGRELTVAVLGDEALPVVEIVPDGGFYDYEHKYTSGKSRYIVPADIPEPLAEMTRGFGLEAFRCLGCAGVARVDFRLDLEGEATCLEVNTVPGMTELSLVPMAAREIGLDFPALTDRLCRLAIEGT